MNRGLLNYFSISPRWTDVSVLFRGTQDKNVVFVVIFARLAESSFLTRLPNSLNRSGNAEGFAAVWSACFRNGSDDANILLVL